MMLTTLQSISPMSAYALKREFNERLKFAQNKKLS